MAGPVEFMLVDLKEKYEKQAVSSSYTRLYDDAQFGHMFAVFHAQLNQHFDGVNDRAKSTRHYWADHSRDLIALIRELNESLHALERAGVRVILDDGYQKALERCEPWLSSSGGSTVPEGFEQIDVIRYEPVFSRPDKEVKLEKHSTPIRSKMVGEGSYATVHSYVDPDYGVQFAVKKAKRGIGDRDLQRFKPEFDVMKKLSFPYVVEVYQYDEDSNEYRMEFCDETLRHYIRKRNNQLSFAPRKRIALQFLYGLNYIHSQGLLHRDISLQNVLVKVYESGAVLVKLSDFGLVKDRTSEFTRTRTEMRGTIRDPLLDNFRNYGTPNEMYAIGWVLSYIFTGRESLKSGNDEVSRIIQKCAATHDISHRYESVRALIADVERLVADPTGPTA